MTERLILRRTWLLLALALDIALYAPASSAAETVLHGRISDPAGLAVEGAMVFVYSSAEVRKTADFISPRSDRDGRYRIVIPPGTYWVVARQKHAEGYGPLMPGDRHSGEAAEIKAAPGETVRDFVVADLKEALQQKRKEREGSVRISGRVLDVKGSPVVANVYVFASRTATVTGVPEYLSAWVDPEGRFVLYVPPGKYYFGAASAFPLSGAVSMTVERAVSADLSDMNIVTK